MSINDSLLSIFFLSLSPLHFPVHAVSDILRFPLTPGCLCALSRGSWGGIFVAVAVATVVICSSNSKGPRGLNWRAPLLAQQPLSYRNSWKSVRGGPGVKASCAAYLHSIFSIFFFFKERREECLKKAAKISWAKGNTDEYHVICN